MCFILPASVAEALNAYMNFLAGRQSPDYDVNSRVLKLLAISMKRDISMGVDEMDEDFAARLLLRRLPPLFFQPEDELINSIEKTVRDFFDFCDQKHRGKMNSALNNIGINIFPELKRIVKLKKLILRFSRNPVISIEPLVVDIEGYRILKKEKSRETVFLSDEFVFFEFFGRNSVVLKKEGEGGYFLRIYLDSESTAFFRKGDRIRLKLKRRNDYSSWLIDGVYEIQPVVFDEILNKKGAFVT